MRDKVMLLKAMFYAPAIVAALRMILTVVVLIWNPLGMSLRFFQIIPLGVIAVSVFTYLKLYSDSDPVMSVLLPMILHFIVIWVFLKKVEVVPFIPLIFVDVLYLVIKGIKGMFFPFEIEGEDDEEEELLNELEEA